MINEKVTNEELEIFIKEPVNGVMVMPNMHMVKSMAKELLELRTQNSNLRLERDALREDKVGKGSNTRNAADIYFQLIEEYNVNPSQGLVQFVEHLFENQKGGDSKTYRQRATTAEQKNSILKQELSQISTYEWFVELIRKHLKQSSEVSPQKLALQVKQLKEARENLVDENLISLPIELIEDYYDMKVNEVEEYKFSYKGYYEIEGSKWFHRFHDLEEELKQIKQHLGE